MNQSCIQFITRLEDILSIQKMCYPPNLVESSEVILNRLKASPHTHWLYYLEGAAVGYLIGYFSKKESIMPFNQVFEFVDEPDCFCIHDLAINPNYQGKGVAQKLLELMDQVIRKNKIMDLSLIAVQNAKSFWERQGFVPINELSLSQKENLNSYGMNATYMRKCIR